jgi:capsid protein
MSILDNVKGFFSKRQKLEDLDTNELRKARVQLEREQARVLRQIDDIEAQKADLDAKGRAERSVRKQKLLAQQILGLESQAKHYDRNLAFFSKQLRVVDGFIFLKENQRVLSTTPLGKVLAEMDTAELQAYVDQATVDGSFQLDKLNQLLGVFEEDEELFKTDEEDEKIADIISGWQADQESEVAFPELDDSLSDLEEAEGEF